MERSLKSVAPNVLHHSITWVNAVWKYVVQRLVGADFQSTAKLPRVIPTTHRAKSCQYCAFAVGCHPTLNHLRTKSSYRLSLLAVHLHIEVTYHLVAFEGGEYAIVCNILKIPLCRSVCMVSFAPQWGQMAVLPLCCVSVHLCPHSKQVCSLFVLRLAICSKRCVHAH